jgi:hypothetical protein
MINIFIAWNMAKGGGFMLPSLVYVGLIFFKLVCSQQLEYLEDKLRELRFVASGDGEQKVCLCVVVPR